jgi:cobyrinic acid a,c-diamide synthase
LTRLPNEIPRVVIAGATSNVGKTTVTAGLSAALRQQGLVVQSFKCGPDYIDPSYHEQATGRPCRNLDTWMLSDAQLLESFSRASQDVDIAVVEGVMGLYDGSDWQEERGSTAQIAKLLNAPVALVLDISGAARSAAAMVLGYKQFDPAVNLAGVVLNFAGSERHARGCAEAIEHTTGLPMLGWLPRDLRLRIPERHLGLVPGGEQPDSAALIAEAAAAVNARFSVEAIVSIARRAVAGSVTSVAPRELHVSRGSASLPAAHARGVSAESHETSAPGVSAESHETSAPGVSAESHETSAPGVSAESRETCAPGVSAEFHESCAPHASAEAQTVDRSGAPSGSSVPDSAAVIAVIPRSGANTRGRPPRPIIAVARDEAFCFYYPENLELLAEEGATVEFFSPLRGEQPGANVAGVYLGGGYPELHGATLASNTGLWKRLQDLHAADAPLYAECGGFMVLTQALTDTAGHHWPMAGLLPGIARMTGKLAALGYRQATALRTNLLAEEGESLRGHEFRYSSWDCGDPICQTSHSQPDAHTVVSDSHERPTRDTAAWHVRGARIDAPEDVVGYARGNLLASYLHVHFGQRRELARRFVDRLR